MSWMQKLYATYEHCCGNAEVADSAKLLPIGHILARVHINVTIDAEGNFVGAELLPAGTRVCIPATEESAGRTGIRPKPHPLADKIRYCAKDYKNAKGEFEDYVALLSAWCKSPNSHPAVKAVLAYVEKGTLVRDLVGAGILFADASGNLLTKQTDKGKDTIFEQLQAKKVGGKTIKDQGEAYVVWTVLLPGTEARTWMNTEVRNAWIAYTKILAQKTGFCMVTGQEIKIAEKHPRDLRAPGDTAKLISCNDDKNFTYRGHFFEAEEASSVGYEVSQKAHNALRWLITRQGWTNRSQVVLAWTEKGSIVPNPCADFSNADEIENYRGQIADTELVSLLVVDSASKGRLSVVMYREYPFSEYLNMLTAWQKDCAWVHPIFKKDEKRLDWTAFVPSIKAIAQTAYGSACDEKLFKSTVERLLPCILDGMQPPRDLIDRCMRRACDRTAFEKIHEWYESVSVACALYQCFRARQGEKKYSIGLDEDTHSRDYLYGRLLGVADYIETTADTLRVSNAKREMQRFKDNPCRTWREIELRFQPDMQKLKSSNSAFFAQKAQETLDVIMDKFDHKDFMAQKQLTPEFLLGYFSQNQAMYKKA